MSRRKNTKPRPKSRNRNQPPSKQGSARWRTRRALGQNFLRYRRDAERIVGASGIGSEDLVVEFGPGSGMLTEPLSRRAARILAVEKDPRYAEMLRRRFDPRSVGVINADARDFVLPRTSFKVVSNIPFGVTTDVLDLLFRNPSRGPVGGSLLLQKDVARKHARDTPTTLKTLSWSPWYGFSGGLTLPSSAFHPRPKVDARVLHFVRREKPLLAPRSKPRFETLVRYAFEYGNPNGVGVPLRRWFSRRRIRRLAEESGFCPDAPPSHLNVGQWVEIFRALEARGC